MRWFKKVVQFEKSKENLQYWGGNESLGGGKVGKVKNSLK